MSTISVLEAKLAAKRELPTISNIKDMLKAKGAAYILNFKHWPTVSGQLIGFCKTIYQQDLDMSDISAFKFADVCSKAAGRLPFVNKQLQIIKAANPDFETLRDCLIYMGEVLGMSEEIEKELPFINQETWDKAVAAIMSNIESQPF